jgi:sugar/nucleoside kinase (ribokinase family)
VRPLAVVGNLSLDRVDGGEPRAGGAPFHAARALRALCRPALVAVKAAEPDRRALLPPLVRLGLPVLWRGGETTAAFSFSYSGNRRSMVVDALGPQWAAADLRGLERAGWVHAGAIARSDFPAETLALLARDRRLSFDGQGLVRPARTGPLALDADFDPEVLRHVSILKLADEEARVLVGEPSADALSSLGVPEIVVTFGSEGSLVFAEGQAEHVPARALAGEVDPTGAGDAFVAAYLVSRSSGYAPVPAARRASALVADLLGGRLA